MKIVGAILVALAIPFVLFWPLSDSMRDNLVAEMFGVVLSVIIAIVIVNTLVDMRIRSQLRPTREYFLGVIERVLIQACVDLELALGNPPPSSYFDDHQKFLAWIQERMASRLKNVQEWHWDNFEVKPLPVDYNERRAGAASEAFAKAIDNLLRMADQAAIDDPDVKRDLARLADISTTVTTTLVVRRTSENLREIDTSLLGLVEGGIGVVAMMSKKLAATK